MQTQHLAAQSLGITTFEAFESQTSCFDVRAYQMPYCSGMLRGGCEYANHTSEDEQAGRETCRLFTYRDRRLTCRTVSRALWLWPSWPSWQPAPSRKKNLSWLTQSRSRLSRSSLASLSKVFDLVSGQAFGPVLRPIQRVLRTSGGGSC